jgi:hypothetical protein
VLEDQAGRPEEGSALAEESVSTARVVGDRRVLAFALRHLSEWRDVEGGAEATLREALEAPRAAGDEREAAAPEDRGNGMRSPAVAPSPAGW